MPSDYDLAIDGDAAAYMRLTPNDRTRAAQALHARAARATSAAGSVPSAPPAPAKPPSTQDAAPRGPARVAADRAAWSKDLPPTRVEAHETQRAADAKREGAALAALYAKGSI